MTEKFAKQTETNLTSYRLNVLTSYKKPAFTLAEVLITLGIIGVVAAMTMPVLTAKIKRNVLNQQFKKSYSVLQQAFASATFEVDHNNDCYYIFNDTGSTEVSTDGCYNFITKDFMKHLKLARECVGNALEQGCIPDDYNWTVASGCSYFGADYLKNNSFVGVTNDGMIIFPFSDTRSQYSMPLIGFDINGQKGPNKPGYDIYSLSIVKKSNTLFLGGFIRNTIDSIDTEYIVRCLPISSGSVKRLSEIMK